MSLKEPVGHNRTCTLFELKSFPLPVYAIIYYLHHPPVLLHAHMCYIAAQACRRPHTHASHAEFFKRFKKKAQVVNNSLTFMFFAVMR